MPDRIEGKVAAILDKHTVVINRGSSHGVARGDTFYIYNILGPFEDPDTGESLGTTTDTLSRVTVDTLEDKFCIASTASFRMPAFALGGGLLSNSTRRVLPLPGEGKVEPPNARVVKVGSPVFLVPQQTSEPDANDEVEESGDEGAQETA